MTDVRLAWAGWLRNRRKVVGLTQSELAARVGVALETMRKIETGRRRPSSQVLEILVTHLDLTAEERDMLFEGILPNYEDRPRPSFTTEEIVHPIPNYEDRPYPSFTMEEVVRSLFDPDYNRDPDTPDQ